jgi:hypothetical protein
MTVSPIDARQICVEGGGNAVFVTDFLRVCHDEVVRSAAKRVDPDFIAGHMPFLVGKDMDGTTEPVDPEGLDPVFSQPLDSVVLLQCSFCIGKLV